MIAFPGPLSDDLPTIAEEYIESHEACDKHRSRLRLHAREFHEWRIAQGDRLFDSEVQKYNAWLAEVTAKRVLGEVTHNNYRGTLVQLLKFATPDGEPLPRLDRIKRAQVHEVIKPAFTRDELYRLIDAAPGYKPMTTRTYGRGIKGDVIPRHRPDGIPWSAWWLAFIHGAYSSGQYAADLATVLWCNTSDSGDSSFVRNKTNKTMSFRFSQAALEAARDLKHLTHVLPWEFNMGSYFPREFKKFVASVPGVRPLGAKSIRRSAITYTYMTQGEEAAKTLAGHASFTTTSKHYIDWSIARKPIVSPPEL